MRTIHFNFIPEIMLFNEKKSLWDGLFLQMHLVLHAKFPPLVRLD